MAEHDDEFSVHLLLTRPEAASQRFWDTLPHDVKTGLTLVVSPVMEIHPVENDAEFSVFDTAIFTSSNGVRYAPATPGKRALCVGQATAENARKRGWNSVFVAESAGEFVEAIPKHFPLGSFLHFRGRHTRGDIAARLSALGADGDELIVYDQQVKDLSAEAIALLSGGDTVIAPVFSPRSASQLAAAAPSLRSVHIIAMSQQVANVFAATNCASLHMAEAPTAAYMSKAVTKVLNNVALS
ncbi:MAG: uroporphyrinogen-III synthase [Rhodobacteraceae bacterium]|nr:uroporphyrinogen-III synthase [Paracoccaceae bacterium]